MWDYMREKLGEENSKRALVFLVAFLIGAWSFKGCSPSVEKATFDENKKELEIFRKEKAEQTAQEKAEKKLDPKITELTNKLNEAEKSLAAFKAKEELEKLRTEEAKKAKMAFDEKEKALEKERESLRTKERTLEDRERSIKKKEEELEKKKVAAPPVIEKPAVAAKKPERMVGQPFQSTSFQGSERSYNAKLKAMLEVSRSRLAFYAQQQKRRHLYELQLKRQYSQVEWVQPTSSVTGLPIRGVAAYTRVSSPAQLLKIGSLMEAFDLQQAQENLDFENCLNLSEASFDLQLQKARPLSKGFRGF